MDPIEQALSLHAKIKHRLKAAVLEPNGIDPQSIRTDRTCEFGVWIYGPEGIRHAALPEFKALKDTHKRFHESAYIAMCLCCIGKRAEAEASVTTGEFEQLSKEMIVRLLAMQAALRWVNSPTALPPA